METIGSNSKVDIMIDLETTGLQPGCAIASIGACSFGPNLLTAKSYFHGFAKTPDYRFNTNVETLTWWSKQPESVRAEVFKGTMPIDTLLKDFSAFISTFASVRVWGNSASFDLKILEKAYEICGIELPWEFRDEMCYRTLKQLYPQIPYKKPRTSHIALEDAIAQANHADEILGFKSALELGYYNPMDKEISNV